MTKYTPTDAEMQQINNAFVYHAPKEGQQERYIKLRDTARELAKMILENCPPTRERSLALTNLEQSNMWANAAIARGE